MIRTLALIGAVYLLLLLAACARPEPVRIIETKEVRVPVPASCVPKGLPPPPSYPDTNAALKATEGLDDLLVLLIEGRLMRVNRLGRLEAVVGGCQDISPNEQD